MRFRNTLVTLALGLIAGCMAAGPPLPAETTTPPAGHTPLGMPLGERRSLNAELGIPLILDRTDLRIGTTVNFHHVPDASELHDALQVPLVQHIVLALPEWPTDVNALASLSGMPEETDLIVILAGYPPSRAAADAWNYVGSRVRLVLVVDGPPDRMGMIDDLNVMRQLERVIVDTDRPARTGFERLQRPLSFRKTMD